MKYQQRLRDWKEVIHLDFPQHPVTQRTIEQSVKYARTRGRGNVRIFRGLIYTDKSFEQYRQRVLAKDLP